jgi:two-component system response regulator TrcR
MDPIRLLLVEDEQGLGQVVKETLQTRGFHIFWATNGVEGWSLFHRCKPDICVMDIMMPRKDGLSLVEDIRKVNDRIPIIFLTARTQTTDVIKGLEIGADDYMKKPFSMEELILRIHKLVRRRTQLPISGRTPEPITLGRFSFNYTRLELSFDAQVTQLSQREADLLQLLIDHKNNLLERSTALLKIWGEDNFFTARSMDVFITKLRKYLSADPGLQILNVRGKGYKLVE